MLTPKFDENPTKDWLDALLRNTKYVYQDAGVLWRTLRVLHDLQASQGIVTPTGLRGIIARVYEDDACAPNLVDAADRAHGVASAAAATAVQYALRCADGYVGEGLLWSSDVRVPTRLGNNQTVVRLGRLMPDGSIVPWAPDTGADIPGWYRWALSEIRLDSKRVPMDSKPDSALEALCDEIRRTWGRWEQEIPLLPLRFARERWSGSLIRGDGKVIEIAYDCDSGLSFIGQ